MRCIVIVTYVSYREKYLSFCGEALELAKNMLLLHSPSLQDFAQLQQVAHRGSSGSVATIPMSNIAKNYSSAEKGSPKIRSRANTLIAKPPSTDDMATATKSNKHRTKNSKEHKVERSQTFLGKGEKKERPHTAHVHHRTSSTDGRGARVEDSPDGGSCHSNL